MATDPALVEKILRATLKGFIHFRDLRSQTIAILTRFLKTKEETARIYDLMRPRLTQDAVVNEETQLKSLEHVRRPSRAQSCAAVGEDFRLLGGCESAK